MISRRHDRARSTRHTERNHNYDRIVNGTNSDQMSSQADHTRIPAVHNDERDKFARSANTLKTELRGRKIRISPAMDAEVWKGIASLLTFLKHLHTTLFVFILPVTYVRPLEFRVNELLPTLEARNPEEKKSAVSITSSSNHVRYSNRFSDAQRHDHVPNASHWDQHRSEA